MEDENEWVTSLNITICPRYSSAYAECIYSTPTEENILGIYLPLSYLFEPLPSCQTLPRGLSSRAVSHEVLKTTLILASLALDGLQRASMLHEHMLRPSHMRRPFPRHDMAASMCVLLLYSGHLMLKMHRALRGALP